MCTWHTHKDTKTQKTHTHANIYTDPDTLHKCSQHTQIYKHARTHIHLQTYIFTLTSYRVAKMHEVPYKLQVSFRKRATNYRALLRKMTYENKASYASSPLCTYMPPGLGGTRTCTQKAVCTRKHIYIYIYIYVQTLTRYTYAPRPLGPARRPPKETLMLLKVLGRNSQKSALSSIFTTQNCYRAAFENLCQKRH